MVHNSAFFKVRLDHLKVWCQIKRPSGSRGPFRTTYGIRTRDSSVKGRRLNPLTNAAFPLKDGKDNV